jgi:hypothetical protein
VAEVEGARVRGVEYGVGAFFEVVSWRLVSMVDRWGIWWMLVRTGNLDHVKPAHGILVAAVDGLESAVVRSDGSLGREAAHSQEHVKDVGEALGLVIVVWGTLVQRPL